MFFSKAPSINLTEKEPMCIGYQQINVNTPTLEIHVLLNRTRKSPELNLWENAMMDNSSSKWITGENSTLKVRRTLTDITHYPTPKAIHETISESKGWPYKTRQSFYATRDKALVALTYLLAGRISEVLRLRKNQFREEPKCIVVEAIELSKSKVKGRPRRQQFRPEAFLPLKGERASLSLFVQEYLALLPSETLDVNGQPVKIRLFPFKRVRAWQIINAVTGEPCHWLRAYGENYLYDAWKKDLLAVADYVKVDPQTLQQYIRRSYKKYKPA